MWKYYILYDPNILKSQNYGGNQDISGCQGLVVREEEGTQDSETTRYENIIARNYTLIQYTEYTTAQMNPHGSCEIWVMMYQDSFMNDNKCMTL